MSYLCIHYSRYRLAPEHPYPTPFQDCEAATAYFLKMATQFGVDPKRIAIAGEFMFI